ncbi:ATP-binding protein [Portibacter marinus]|uniref:ATP-binding protein n=1 Tax=Portibacter marinus TaxID=2898660 RepID=UPI001F43EF46|nr:ATP-binding protein [Portibacter marinus]
MNRNIYMGSSKGLKAPLLVFILFALKSAPYSAQVDSTYHILTQYPVHTLDQHIKILPDPEGKLDIEEVIKDTTLSWKPLKRSELEFDLPYVIAPSLETSPVYWGRLQVMAKDTLTDWILNLEDRLFYAGAWGRGNGRVDLYAYSDDQLLFHKMSGTNVLNKEKEFPKEWYLHKFKFDIPVNKTVDLYLRVEENQAAVYPFFNVTLRKEGFTHYHPLRNPTIGNQTLLGGAAIVLLIYHLALFFFLKDRVYLTYSIWLFVISMNFFLLDLNYSDPLTSNLIRWRFTFWIINSTSNLFFFWLFGKSFVRSKEKFPLLDRFLMAYLTLFLLQLIVAGFMAFHKFNVEFGSVIFNMKMMAVLASMGMIFSAVLIFKNDRLARYFGIGSFFGIGFHLLGALWGLGIIQLNFLPFNFGTFILMIAISFLLAFRQQQLASEQTSRMVDAEKAKAEADRIKDLDNLKTKFFSNVSHEFRTPISLILGPLEQAKSKNENNSQEYINLKKRSYDIITKNAKRLQNLVDQLLDLSKLEGTHLKLKLEKGRLQSFSHSIINGFENMAARKQIHLNITGGEEIEEVFFDRDKLEKIITNLISNAIKYTPENGTVSINISVARDYFTLEVKDTGKGISSSETSKIFDRFYRAEGTEQKGSGIGLALVKELVELHNGFIHVNSVLGSGTSFKVKIPCALHLLPKNVTILNENVTLYTSNPQFGQEPESIPILLEEDSQPSVLLVEDNEDLCHFLRDIVSENYKVIEAVNGEEGETKAIQHIPDIIISDVMMPKKDGFALCHDLKNNSKTSHIPIILLTAKAGQENKMDGLYQGADAYLTKPFDQEELMVRIKNLIDARRKLWAKLKDLDTSILKNIDLKSADDEFLKNVFEIVQKNLDNEQLSIDDVAQEVNFSRSQLHRKLKAIINKSPNQLIVEMRLNEAKRMLQKRAGNVSEIAYSVGYSSLPYFTKSFKKHFGILPSKVAGPITTKTE